MTLATNPKVHRNREEFASGHTATHEYNRKKDWDVLSRPHLPTHHIFTAMQCGCSSHTWTKTSAASCLCATKWAYLFSRACLGTPVCRLCGRYLAILGRPIRITVPSVTVAPTVLVGSLIRSSNLPHSLQRGVHSYIWLRQVRELDFVCKSRQKPISQLRYSA